MAKKKAKIPEKINKGIPQSQTLEGISKRHLLAIVVLSISIFLAYSNSLNGTWAMDDVVVNKSVGIKDLHDFIGFRKVAYITFLLNQYIAPFSPANFRLFNILIHILNAALVYMLAYRTIPFYPPLVRGELKGGHHAIHTRRKSGDLFATTHNQAFYVAFLSSIIFALHPININAVAYIVQRMASLATLFVLLSLLCYISATQLDSKLKTTLLYMLSGLCVIAGIFSKENAVMAIPLIILYDYIFLSRFKGSIFIKRMLVIGGIGILCIGLASYFLRLHTSLIDIARFFMNPNSPLTEKGWMSVDVYWTPLQHILTEFRVVSRYIFLIFIPLPRFLVFDWWGFTISKGITELTTTLLSIILLMSLFIFSVWKIRRFPLLCFGILWYLIAISLESFFALGADLYFEHRNYLPVSGLIIGIVGQIVVSFNGKIKEKAVWTTAIVLCIAFGSLTFSRNFVWKDSITLWGDTLKKNPSNIRALMSMGNAYLRLSRFDNAKNYYNDAMKISLQEKRRSFLNGAVYRLGMMYLFERNLEQAKKILDAFGTMVESYNMKILKGFYKAATGETDEALMIYHEVLPQTKGIDTVVVYTLIGDTYREKGLWDKAIEQYNKATSADQAFAAAYYGTGVAYLAKRNVELAGDYFNKALSLEPDNVLALSDMADLMLMKKSNTQVALTYAQKAVSNSPPFYQPYLTMGNVFIVLGRDKDADEFYKRATERGMADYMVPFSKARAYYLRGDIEKAKYYLSELQRYKDLPEKIKNIIK
jgi:tetratricopeptide (TPR) repeat protein